MENEKGLGDGGVDDGLESDALNQELAKRAWSKIENRPDITSSQRMIREYQELDKRAESLIRELESSISAYQRFMEKYEVELEGGIQDEKERGLVMRDIESYRAEIIKANTEIDELSKYLESRKPSL